MTNLDDAKDWLTLDEAAASLGSSVPEVLKLVAEGQLAISWYARNAHARAVEPIETADGKAAWKPIDGQNPIGQINGAYRLALEHAPSVKAWIDSSLAGADLQLAPDGLFVTDSEHQILQIMDYQPGELYRVKNRMERMEGTYHPTRKFPDETELAILREDLEAFGSG